jgi:hypothetical protein
VKINLKSNILPVLGWADMSVSSYYVQLEKEMNDGTSITYNNLKDLIDGDISVFLFYEDYEKDKLHSIYSGEVRFVGLTANHLAPYTYEFYPSKRIEFTGIGYCKCCGVPDVVMVKSKKL